MNLVSIIRPTKAVTTHSTQKVCNALASALSDLDSAIEATYRIGGMKAADSIICLLEQAREKVNAELALAKLRHGRLRIGL